MYICLYFSCMKLKHYIKPIDVYISSHFDVIKHMISKPFLHNRIGKWALALTEYSLTYVHLEAMNGQMASDFFVDHAIVEAPQNYLEPERWKLYFDGSSNKNENDIRILIISPNKIPTKFKYRIDGSCLNNEVEYEALIACLEILLDLGKKRVEVREDSELVVKKKRRNTNALRKT